MTGRMKIIIEPTRSLDQNLTDQIKQHSSILLDDDSDNWVNFAHQWVSGVVCSDNDELLSYWVIGQDALFTKNMAQYMWLSHHTSITLMYLFTVEQQRRKWYAKQLFDALNVYIDRNYPTVDHLILSCSEKNKWLYTSRWWKLVTCSWINTFLRKEGIDEDNFFQFGIRE